MSDLLSRYLPTAIAIIFLIILFVRTRQHRLAAEKIKNEIKNRYAGQTVFFCDNCEDLGKNLVQFFGDSCGGSIRPKDALILPDGRQYTIKEVYIADDTPSVPKKELTNGMKNCAIVIDSPRFNFATLNQVLKTETIAVFKVISQ